jgi:hypothetical protein
MRSRTLDDLLGPAEGRFFGSGYRRVGQRLDDLSIVDGEGGLRLTATGGVRYPADWSTKRHGAVPPHLSTIDAIVLAARLTDACVTAAHGLDAEQRRAMWVRRLDVNAGPRPLEAGLEAFGVQAEVARSRPAPHTLLGHLSLVDCWIGPMRVGCLVEHSPGGGRRDTGATETTGPYVDGFKRRRHRVENLTLDATGRARVLTAVDVDGPAGEGMEARYHPSVSIVDIFTVALQLGQALLYRQDGLERATTSTLWMRRAVIRPRTPHRPAGIAFPVGAELAGSRLLPARGATWRLADVVASGRDVLVRCSVAHQLPDLAATRAAEAA